ncbi:tRNA lysidine(34) synthetase TilS [Corynebacterium uberis]|uniref:tRNA lysidine(34) synthetase TilS n=1 Tax=Corynebacterium TaxID=1716 RepID=UPI001D0B20F8|nr:MULTISPECIES: tRNA lysidine(34) synthetase TilS [Corynebacterium]MCZ9309750.1 tRNA lysidine(34) synthetase TilS [Corynebacterium sp. c6VSa_13]UDL73553.1 tRNA lysidine(34) synthetase TilS [Corynebacterium uberis]UDL75567.1 tRNA lysidine(34) synthetase TilS [Corynebacterium uberis]UDL77780.1 tRNA lysidine(34) synthetase TilS [Corynebacterium uberis]UDL82196.1 tRNA lysidine(34) synthetase TilS [Corynebacterium uberis]
MMLNLPHDPPHFLQVRLGVRRHVRAHLAGVAEVCVGLSGGPDSLALLAGVLAEGLAATALIVDHQLQEGSGAVAARAAEQARAWGANTRVLPVTVAGEGGMEAAARRARLEALQAAACGAPVLLGHTLDDQAETFLLAALRATPGGMLPVRDCFHRPLLAVRRADTHGACAELGIQPWHDPQNCDVAYRRVAVRHLLPTLADALHADPAPPLAGAATRAAADAAAVEQWAASVDPTDVAALAALPPAVRSRALARLIRDAGGRVTQNHVAAVDALVMTWHGQGPVDVSGGVRVRRDGGLVVERASTEQ